MKKAFIIFAALFIAYASIGYFFAIDKSFRNELITKFGNSAYITAKPANIKKGKKLLQKTAKEDRKSTRLNSSHYLISYAVFCLKKKKIIYHYD